MYQHFKHVFSEHSKFSSEHVEQFISQSFKTNANYTETEQQYDTSLLDAPITRDEVQKTIYEIKSERNKTKCSAVHKYVKGDFFYNFYMEIAI